MNGPAYSSNSGRNAYGFFTFLLFSCGISAMPAIFLLIEEWWARIDLEFDPGAGVSCMGEETVNQEIDRMRVVILHVEVLNSALLAILCFTRILTCDGPAYNYNSGRKVYGFLFSGNVTHVCHVSLHLEWWAKLA